jgi:hypothetical protein
VRLGDQRDERGQVDLGLLVVARAGIGAELDELVLAPLAAQEVPGLLVGREDRGGRTQLGDHVADGRPLGDRERGHPWAGELEDPIEAALDRVPLDEVKDEVLAGHPGRQLAAQMDADDAGCRGPQGPASHGHGHLEAAGADRDRAAGAGGRRMRVGTEQGRPRASEALGVDLVADAVARPRVPEAVPGRERLQEQVVVGVAVVEQEHIVVDVLHGELDADALQAERLELHAGHRPGRVLQQGLVDSDADLLARGQPPLDQVLGEDLAGHRPLHHASNAGGDLDA